MKVTMFSKQKISERSGSVLHFFPDLSDIWLNRGELNFHTCFWIQSIAISPVIQLLEPSTTQS